ncbi:MAG: BMP family ABC transporter substrate-binding protein, partial [Anaerolineae bacterium]
FVGGIELTTYVEGMKSFEVGAKWANPDATVLIVWTGDFDDAPKAKEATISHLEQGADVIAHATNLGVYGIIEAIEDREDVYFIGKDVDQSPLLPERTLTSMYINYARGMQYILPQVAEGQLGGVYTMNLADNSVVVTDLGPSVSEEIADSWYAVKDLVSSEEIDAMQSAEDLEAALQVVEIP